jgi:hypothetical protein
MKIIYGDSTQPEAPPESGRMPDRQTRGASWDYEHAALASSHHDFEDHLKDIVVEARNAVRAEAEACAALRRALANALATLRGLGADSEGLWFPAYLAITALVIVAEVATGIANAWLITVPPAVRSLLLVAFVVFPPLTAIALGEVLRPWRYRRPVGAHYRIAAVLLGVFAVAYLVITYRLRALSVTLGTDEPLLPSDLEAAALCAIAGAGYILAVVAGLTRESWSRFKLSAQVRRLKSALKMHGARLARARTDLARTHVSTTDEEEPPSTVAGDGSSVPRAPAVAAIALALCVAATAQGALAAPPRCADPVAWLRTAIPADSRVVLIVTTQQMTEAQQSLDRAMARAVVGCAGARSTITVRAVTATALTDAPVWQGVAPSESTGDPYASVRGQPFMTQASGAIDRVIASPAPAVPLRSDILGALAATGQQWSIAPRTGTRVVFVLASGWQESADLNLFRYKTGPATQIDGALRALRRDGTLPDLAGASVYIAGLNPGAAGMGTTKADVTGLCAFWRAVVTAAKGDLRLCAGALPGIAQN